MSPYAGAIAGHRVVQGSEPRSRPPEHPQPTLRARTHAAGPFAVGSVHRLRRPRPQPGSPTLADRNGRVVNRRDGRVRIGRGPSLSAPGVEVGDRGVDDDAGVFVGEGVEDSATTPFGIDDPWARSKTQGVRHR